MNDGFIELGAVFETAPLMMRFGMGLVRGSDKSKTVKVGADGQPQFAREGQLLPLRPRKPTVCAAVVLLEAPLFTLFSGFADLEAQLRGVALGPESLGALNFLEFSREQVTKGVGGDPRVELAFLVASGSDAAAAARRWRDDFRRNSAGRPQQIEAALASGATRTTPGHVALPPTVSPPRELFRSLNSKIMCVEHFDGAKVTAPDSSSPMQGALHFASVERLSAEARARSARTATVRGGGSRNGCGGSDGEICSDGSSNDGEVSDDDQVAADADIYCMRCGDGESMPPNEIVVCDRCGRGEHLGCVQPQTLFQVPDEAWFCSQCRPVLEPFMPPPGRSTPDFGAAVLEGDAGASGRGGEFVGKRAVALFASQQDVRTASRGVGNANKYAFPLMPCGGPETPISRVGLMRPIQPGRAHRERQNGTREGCSSQGLPGVFGSIYPGRKMAIMTGRDVRLAARDSHYNAWLESMAFSRVLTLAAAKDLGLLDTDPATTAGDLFGGKAAKPRTRISSDPNVQWMGKHDAFVVAYAQLELGCKAAESVAEVVRLMAAVRMCRNREHSSIHLDSCKRGFMSFIEFTFAEYARLTLSEQRECRRNSKPHPHEVRFPHRAAS